MLNELKYLPNQLTALRLLLIPVLWICALQDLSIWVGVGLAFAYLTDILDGFAARRLKRTSAFGAKFDSLADNLLQPCVLAWLWILKPAVFLDFPVLWLAAVTVYFSSIAVGLIKFKRFGNLHLYSSRYGSVLMIIFAVHTFIASQYSVPLLFLALISSTLSSTETLILQLALDHVSEHLGSIFLVASRKRA